MTVAGGPPDGWCAHVCIRADGAAKWKGEVAPRQKLALGVAPIADLVPLSNGDGVESRGRQICHVCREALPSCV